MKWVLIMLNHKKEIEMSGKLVKTQKTIQMDWYHNENHVFQVFHVEPNLIVVIDAESPTNDWFPFEFEWEAVEYIQNRVWARELIQKTK